MAFSKAPLFSGRYWRESLLVFDLLAIPRIFAPTPLFLLPTKKVEAKDSRPFFPFVPQEGYGTPLFSKGRNCLGYILKAFKEIRPDRSEVIIPAYNAQSLVFATLFNHLTPVLVDIDTRVFFPTFDAIGNAISSKTLAVFLPYNWGIFPSLNDLSRIHQLLLDKELFWIDDLATSIPSQEYTHYLANNSPCMFFSYGKTKILSIMDGGNAFFPKKHLFFHKLFPIQKDSAISLTTTPHLKTAVFRLFENLAFHFYCSKTGFELLSKLGIANIDHPPRTSFVSLEVLPQEWESCLTQIISIQYQHSLERRKDCFLAYHNLLYHFLTTIYLFPSTKENVGSRFPLLCNSKAQREQLKTCLDKKGIGSTLGHICWLRENPLISSALQHYSPKDFPNAVDFQDRLLTLPAHSRVSRKDMEEITLSFDQVIR